MTRTGELRLGDGILAQTEARLPIYEAALQGPSVIWSPPAPRAIFHVSAPTVGAEARLRRGGVRETANSHRGRCWKVHELEPGTKAFYGGGSGRLWRARIDEDRHVTSSLLTDVPRPTQVGCMPGASPLRWRPFPPGRRERPPGRCVFVEYRGAELEEAKPGWERTRRDRKNRTGRNVIDPTDQASDPRPRVADGPSFFRTVWDWTKSVAVKAVYGAEIPGVHVRVPGFAEPERGDVIVFHPPHDPAKNYVKRLIGLPGDTLEMRGKDVYVNSVLQEEPYARYLDRGGDAVHPSMSWQHRFLPASLEAREYRPSRDNWGPIVVPEGRFFVLGGSSTTRSDRMTPA